MAGTNLWEALYNDTPPPSVTTSSSDFQNMPAWYQDYQKGMLKYAASTLPTNPVLYQGNRLADLSNPQTAQRVEQSFSPDERNAFQSVRNNQGSYQPYMSSASALTQGAAAGANTKVGDYMSPYISNVTDRLAMLAGRNLSENILPRLSDTFVGAGQMSATRMGEFTSRAIRDTQDSLLGQQGQLLNQGYQSAMGSAQADLSRQLAAGQQMGALGGLQQTYGLTDAAAQQGVGQAISNKAQQGADIDYNNFIQQRDWSLRNLGALNAALRGTQVPISQSTYSSAPLSSIYGNSPLANVAGAINQIASLPYKRGGRVMPQRHTSPLWALTEAA